MAETRSLLHPRALFLASSAHPRAAGEPRACGEPGQTEWGEAGVSNFHGWLGSPIIRKSKFCHYADYYRTMHCIMMKFTFADSRSPFGLLNNDEIYFCGFEVSVRIIE